MLPLDLQAETDHPIVEVDVALHDLPQWFERPLRLTVEYDKPYPQMASWLCDKVAKALAEGRLGLPIWQRAPVWSQDQRINFLDTMMRRIPSGTILLWRPPYGVEVESRPFPGGPPLADASDAWSRPWLVVDGQQRLTTILMAVRGELPVFWNGSQWGERGMISAQMCMDSFPSFEFYSGMARAGLSNAELASVVRAFSRVARYEFQVCEMDGFTEEEARAVYERMAACGTPHDPQRIADVIERTSIWTGGERD